MKAALSRVGRLVRLPRSSLSGRNGHARPGNEPPLRAELFSVDQLRHYAKALAGWQEIDPRPGPDRLLPRLADNEQVLRETYNLISAAVEADRRIAPAAEWLLDNFYIIEEQIRLARRHFPRGYSRELPRLANGPLAGYPRVYHLILEIISHGDGRVDAENLGGFVAAYQSVAALKLGELWAIPIMLRLALLENLRRVSLRIAADRRDRDRANYWADRLLEVSEADSSKLILVLAELVRERPQLSSAFVVEFSQRLQGQSPAMVFPITWLEQQLNEQSVTLEQLNQQENQNQAADQVSISNSIQSLRFLGSMDWREFVESQSIVEQTLRGDPADVYNGMDFETRDRYRHVVEKLARQSPLEEDDIARRAVQLARESLAAPPTDEPASHVGYYLIGKGRAALRQRAAVRFSIPGLVRRLGRRWPLAFYTSTIALVTLAIVTGGLHYASTRNVPAWGLALLFLPLALVASQAGISFTNWLSTLVTRPRRLPRMDYSHGIPTDCRTMVVVPSMLSRHAAVESLLESLEVRYLANRDENLHFALLTDFCDASQEIMPGDEELLDLARDGIEDLNARYGRDDAFFLFHRPRRWNESQGVWMGWERKRGKLADFNALLRGGPADRFSLIVGRTDILPSIRYVITLDSDTQLPRDAARQLVATMTHPLNRPRFDPVRGRVIEGYGILQPRVGVSLPSAARSWYAWLFAGEAGIDPYTRAVSDVYQDLFGEGSFIGKGIYDVDSFQRACGQLPENRILSHDLLEGAYARAGLVTDVLLFEDYPSRYAADVSRRHRWVRGDWQIASWILPRVPGPYGQSVRNPISALSRWKIFDNLRRSLVAPAVVALLLAAWATPGLAVAGTLLVLGIFALPAVLTAGRDVFRRTPDLPPEMHFKIVGVTAGRQLAQAFFAIAILPHETFLNLDAIIRTLARLMITRRHLLEWQTAVESERNARTDIVGVHIAMSMSPALAATAWAAMATWQTSSLPASLPVLVLWLISPALAWWMSRILPRKEQVLAPKDIAFLGRVSRLTWRFFETFVGPADNWLPPDNFQEHPAPVVAHRTSPTNIALSMLANLAAWDLGYISARRLIERTSKTLDTLDRMERYRGHLFNWYDTRTLQPLSPRYISSVDSGNLAGHLLTLAPGLLQVGDEPILPPRAFGGLLDTLGVLRRAFEQGSVTANEQEGGATPITPKAGIAAAPQPLPESGARLEEIAQELNRLGHTVRNHSVTSGPPLGMPAADRLLLQQMTAAAGDFAKDDAVSADEECRWWAHALESQCRDFIEELDRLAPWTSLPPAPELLWQHGESDRIARLTELREALGRLDPYPTLRQVAELDATLLPTVDAILADSGSHEQAPPDEEQNWLRELRQAVAQASQYARDRLEQLDLLVPRCQQAADVNFDFLYDRSRHLLTIGYDVADHRPDQSFYDLLASEARMASFVAIAQGKLPQEHWFSLGRLLTAADGELALLSWSGSMFEYLMPMLVMPSYENTLLDQTCHSAVRRQIEYGRQRGIPWGFSESGYNTTDVDLNYQYRAFGVPGLGLKRGLADDLVVAPYATVMATMVAPRDAVQNLRRLIEGGGIGRYGFYEAIDFTPARVPRGQAAVVVRSFMAHHEGMSLLSLAYLLAGKPMQRRFESDPLFKAADLLLQERIPRSAPMFPHMAEVASARRSMAEETPQGILRVFKTPNTPAPEVHLLSNGRYHVMVTAAGGGYSRLRDLAVTRWHEDATRDCWGSFCYLRDTRSGEFWSVAYQPTLKRPSSYEAVFSQARAEFRRRDGDIDTHTEISVSPEDELELRRITISNRGPHRRTIELTSYAEVVLATPASDAAHPAFSKLFVQTEIRRARQAILCTRRPRSIGDRTPWLIHLMSSHPMAIGEPSFETDRRAFLGRGRTVANPAALSVPDLSNTEGAVLDPIVSIRRSVSIGPDETIKIDLITGVADTHDAALALIEKYQDRRMADRVFELAWTHSQVGLRQLNATEAEAQLYGRLAGSILYATPQRRASASIITQNRRGQAGLWGYGISGDLPIVLLRVGDVSRIELVRQVVRAHAYWRMKGLAVDLIIWNEDVSGYRQALHDAIMGVIMSSASAQLVDKPGGIFVRRIEQISEEDKVLMQTLARAVITDTAGTLADQIERRWRAEPPPPRFIPTRRLETPVPSPRALQDTRPPGKNLTFFNGLGGFSRDGREYVITSTAARCPPAPWSNVIANPHFGTVVTESGAAYTWLENAHELRLTPWYNDPVSDASGECFYIRDEETGRFWSPCPLPARGATPYTTRHGQGYSVFEHAEEGIASEMTTFVAIDAPVKFYLFKIANHSGRPRRISLTAYLEWVLGEQRARSAMHIITELDPQTGALLAHNYYNPDFPERMAFLRVSESQRTVTGNRTEFISRNGTIAHPAAMNNSRLSGKVGAGMDPCGAMQTIIDLPDDQEREVVFLLGAAQDVDDVHTLIKRFRSVEHAHDALEVAQFSWTRTLEAVHIETPEPAVDFLVNAWLPYQVLSCRYWARSGFYQSGGAFGFRDQLQDVLALLHSEPRMIRAHLLRCAEHQFREGDVQHWWHPPQGRGVRTRISDDYLWLPYATCRYVLGTGDTGVLDEQATFLEGRPVKPDEESYYDLPVRTEDAATLYEHCVRAIRHGLRFGEHGLPLMGCGDWNDGMNLVGAEGKGESVWLAFFLYDVLTQFGELARRRGDAAFAGVCASEAARLRQNIEQNAWDGQWYLRAWFDSGEPLGSATSPECQVDALPQSWAILSNAGDPERCRTAMEAVDARLVHRDARLIQLFDPPFDRSILDPGYIRGYLPGVRENGGQYTHAAVWTIMAFAASGNAAHAWELFSLINPITHGSNVRAIQTYQVEPYVAVADVYTNPQHVGRGGWTWYTGSAGWMYRLLIESLLGLRLEVDRLRIQPVLPASWRSYKIQYRYRETFYRITIQNNAGQKVTRVVVDGVEQADNTIPLADDRQDHQVEVQIG